MNEFEEMNKMCLSTDEACQQIGVSKPVLYSFLRRAVDPLPHIKVGRQYRIPVRLLQDWLIRQSQSTAS